MIKVKVSKEELLHIANLADLKIKDDNFSLKSSSMSFIVKENLMFFNIIKKCRKNNQQIFKFVWLFKITYDKMNA